MINIEKIITIAVTGVENAGKSSVIMRLVHNTFMDGKKSTMGMDVEYYTNDSISYRFYDLGGQLAFRQLLWKEYIKTSNGLIFVFDSSDPQTITDGKVWFETVVQWSSVKTPILFLANKNDLPSALPLPTVIDYLDIKRLMEMYNPRPFQIIHCSAKTGEGITEATQWLLDQCKAVYVQSVKIEKLVVISQRGSLLAELHFRQSSDCDESELRLDQINSFLKASESCGYKALSVNEKSILALIQQPFTIIVQFSTLINDVTHFHPLLDNCAQIVLQNHKKAPNTSPTIYNEQLHSLIETQYSQLL